MDETWFMVGQEMLVVIIIGAVCLSSLPPHHWLNMLILQFSIFRHYPKFQKVDSYKESAFEKGAVKRITNYWPMKNLWRICGSLRCGVFFRFSCCKLYLKKLLYVHSSSSCMPGWVCDNHKQVGFYYGLRHCCLYSFYGVPYLLLPL